MTTIERRKHKGRYQIFNTDTNRWVYQNSRTGTSFMNKYELTRIGTKDSLRVPNFTRVVHKEIRGGWVEDKYSRETSVSISLLANAILSKLNANMTNVRVTVVSQDAITKEATYEARSILIPTGITKKRLLRLLINTQYTIHGHGSDKFGINQDLKTTYFSLTYKQKLVGNSGRKDLKSIKTEYLKSWSFPAKHGDCLLAIFSKLKRIKTIRKDLNLEGGVCVEDIPKLENYLKVNIDIFSDNIIITKKIQDSVNNNSTNVEYEYEYFYKSPDKQKGEKFEILLKNNHYSLIYEKIPLVFDRTCGDRLKVVKGKPVKLKPLAIKKSLIRQGRKIAGEKVEENCITKYLVYDIETIFNPKDDSLLEAYSVSWHVSPEKIIDITEENIKKYMKETEIIVGKDCIKKFVNWIENNSKGIKYILIGYNNSRFDNFKLLQELIKEDVFTSLVFAQNSLLKLRFCSRHESFDLCRFVMSSLDKACKNFKIYPKKLDGFSHYEPQDAFMKSGWDGLNEWIENNRENLVLYNKTDVLATLSLFKTVKEAYQKMTNANVIEYSTLASMSYDNFKKKLKGSKYDPLPPIDHKDDKFIRSAIIGGRCQDFKKQKCKEEFLAMVDVKSLYPYIMMNMYFPYGEYEYTKKYVNDKAGIYNVLVKKQPKVKIIPRSPLETEGEKILNWDYDGEIEKVMTNIEIECLKRYGGEIEFIKDDEGYIGLYWEKSTKNLFKKHFEPIKEEKSRQDKLKDEGSKEYNPALRNIAKLLLNSLSGKMVQRNFDTTVEMAKNEKEEKKLENKTDSLSLLLNMGPYKLLEGKLKEDKIYNTKRAKPSYLGVFIYAHARTYMYDMLYSNYEVRYTDTDSGALNKDDWEVFKESYIKKFGEGVNEYYKPVKEVTDRKTMGSDFGQFEEELGGGGKKFETHIIGKKLYCIQMMKDGKICSKSKYRIKGVSIEKDRLITSKQVEKINECNEEDKVEYIYNLKKRLDKEHDKKPKIILSDDSKVAEDTIEIFRQLSIGKAYFLCGGIKKTNKLFMKQSYSIKILSNENLTEIIPHNKKIEINKTIGSIMSKEIKSQLEIILQLK